MQTLDDFGLTGGPTQVPAGGHALLELHMGVQGPPVWKSFQITKWVDAESSKVVTRCSVSAAHNAHVTTPRLLFPEEEPADSDWTYHAAVVLESTRAAGADPRQLRFIGAESILYPEAVERLFRREGRDYNEPDFVVVAGPGEPGSPEEYRFGVACAMNPLAYAHYNMVRFRSEELGGAVIKQIIFISEGSDNDDPPNVHMLTELTRP